MHFKKLCVFCGTKSGKNPAYEQTGHQLGRLIAENDLELVYGAGGTGVMRAIADGAKSAGGHVTGITIQHLFDVERPDLMNNQVDEVKVYQRMFARKVAMTELSDAFAILPGGLGTMDELFELMVLKQLGIMEKPIVILNVNSFYDGLRSLLHQLVSDGFVRPEHAETITFVENVEDIIPTIRAELKQLAEKKKQ